VESDSGEGKERRGHRVGMRGVGEREGERGKKREER
jgi:hypothetical protein